MKVFLKFKKLVCLSEDNNHHLFIFNLSWGKDLFCIRLPFVSIYFKGVCELFAFLKRKEKPAPKPPVNVFFFYMLPLIGDCRSFAEVNSNDIVKLSKGEYAHIFNSFKGAEQLRELSLHERRLGAEIVITSNGDGMDLIFKK